MRSSLAVIALLTGAAASAIPAYHGLMTFRQADGSEVPVYLRGDEHFHYYLSEDAKVLATGADGSLYFARLNAQGRVEPSDVLATAVAERPQRATALVAATDQQALFAALQQQAAQTPLRTITPRPLPSLADMKAAQTADDAQSGADPQKAPTTNPGYGKFPNGAFPDQGDQKVLVILVEYNDVTFTLGSANAKTYFTNMLNQEGFSQYGGTGSAKDFFNTVSNGQFRPEFDVYGPVTLSQNRSYYGGNDRRGDDKNPEQMAIEACTQLDATVNFADYDRDGDGEIDNVFIFYAGDGEATGGISSTVWPHAWYVKDGANITKYFDGKLLNRYGCTNESVSSQLGYPGNVDGAGTFIHEFSHVMGLPDLYTTDYAEAAYTPGEWSCMDYGPYNNNGRTPPLYGAFERFALGWMTPEQLGEPADVTLQPISTNTAAIITTSDEKEFFLLENRQQSGWDAYLPGHGMLVWHVAYDATIWNGNKVNNSKAKQYVDIEEAGNDNVVKWNSSKQDTNTHDRSTDPFPGTDGVTTFTDDTTPNMKTWAGISLDTPLTDITENADQTITFKVKGGASSQPDPEPEPEPAGDITVSNLGIVEGTGVYTPNRHGDQHQFSLRWTVEDSESETCTFTPVFLNASGIEMGRGEAQTVQLFAGEPTDMTYTGVLAADGGGQLSVGDAQLALYRGEEQVGDAEDITILDGTVHFFHSPGAGYNHTTHDLTIASTETCERANGPEAYTGALQVYVYKTSDCTSGTSVATGTVAVSDVNVGDEQYLTIPMTWSTTPKKNDKSVNYYYTIWYQHGNTWYRDGSDVYSFASAGTPKFDIVSQPDGETVTLDNLTISADLTCREGLNGVDFEGGVYCYIYPTADCTSGTAIWQQSLSERPTLTTQAGRTAHLDFHPEEGAAQSAPALNAPQRVAAAPLEPGQTYYYRYLIGWNNANHVQNPVYSFTVAQPTGIEDVEADIAGSNEEMRNASYFTLQGAQVPFAALQEGTLYIQRTADGHARKMIFRQGR